MDRTAMHSPATAERVEAAADFARQAHAGQRRKQNGHPFVEHPLAVAELLAERDLPESLLVCGLLHDTVEKTDTSLDEIERDFGAEVAHLVEALSEDKTIRGYAARKRALRARACRSGREAAIVYAADRLANLRDWHELSPERRSQAARRLGTTLEQRVLLWGEDLETLTALDPGLPFLEEVELELRRLRAESC